MTGRLKDDSGSLEESKEFLTMMVGNQMFGIPVLQVQDVLSARKLTRVPLAPQEVAGAMNLRGRIVTAIDMHHKLSMPEPEGSDRRMYIVAEHDSELYSLIVDSVGDVLSLPDSDFEKTPATISQSWRNLSMGVYRLEGNLLVILNVPAMLEEIYSAVKEESVA